VRCFAKLAKTILMASGHRQDSSLITRRVALFALAGPCPVEPMHNQGRRISVCRKPALESSDGRENALRKEFPTVYLARHGKTAWSLTGQLTGILDLSRTVDGEHAARGVGARLKGLALTKVFSSPLQRAHQTCELSGFGSIAENDPDLVEWDYGRYEGRREGDIQAKCPVWNLFREGCPGGDGPPT
jgi:hypothetical protein